MKWVIALLVIFLYVHLFNQVASMYFASDRTMTLSDIWDKLTQSLRNLG